MAKTSQQSENLDEAGAQGLKNSVLEEAKNKKKEIEREWNKNNKLAKYERAKFQSLVALDIFYGEIDEMVEDYMLVIDNQKESSTSRYKALVERDTFLTNLGEKTDIYKGYIELQKRLIGGGKLTPEVFAAMQNHVATKSETLLKILEKEENVEFLEIVILGKKTEEDGKDKGFSRDTLIKGKVFDHFLKLLKKNPDLESDELVVIWLSMVFLEKNMQKAFVDKVKEKYPNRYFKFLEHLNVMGIYNAKDMKEAGYEFKGNEEEKKKEIAERDKTYTNRNDFNKQVRKRTYKSVGAKNKAGEMITFGNILKVLAGAGACLTIGGNLLANAFQGGKFSLRNVFGAVNEYTVVSGAALVSLAKGDETWSEFLFESRTTREQFKASENLKKYLKGHSQVHSRLLGEKGKEFEIPNTLTMGFQQIIAKLDLPKEKLKKYTPNKETLITVLDEMAEKKGIKQEDLDKINDTKKLINEDLSNKALKVLWEGFIVFGDLKTAIKSTERTIQLT